MSSWLKKDVSDAEIRERMAPRVLELMRSVVERIVPQAQTVAREPKSQWRADEARPDAPGITPFEREYLESVVERPNLSVTGRRDYLGHSSYQNNEIKRSVVEKGLIEEFSVNLGTVTGGIVKLQEMTKQGYRALGLQPRELRPHNVSAEHFFWQRNITTYFTSKGLHAQMEMQLNGVRADVGVIKGDRKVAIEVGITPKNEVANVQRDLAAGFDEVVVAARNTRVQKAIEERLWPVLDSRKRSCVKVMLLSELTLVKDLLKSTVGQRAVQRL